MEPISSKKQLTLAVGFQLLIDSCLELQIEAYGHDPTKMEGDERATFITWNAYALIDEMAEAMQEVGWKPWASSRHVNKENFAKEMVDLLHFFANLCAATGVTGDDLARYYVEKRQRNLERQIEGYDGTSSKCPRCGREYADADCSPGARITNGLGYLIRTTPPWCQEYGVF